MYTTKQMAEEFGFTEEELNTKLLEIGFIDEYGLVSDMALKEGYAFNGTIDDPISEENIQMRINSNKTIRTILSYPKEEIIYILTYFGFNIEENTEVDFSKN